MQIRFKKFLLAGTAIVMFGAAGAPGEAVAQCATAGAIAADCTFSDPATTGAITLNDGVDIIFSSSTSQIFINDTIDAATLGGSSTIATGGNGTIVFQSASNIGATTAIDDFTLNAGDFWYTSASTLNLSSAGTFTLDNGTLTLLDGGVVDAGESSFNGGTSADSIIFGSAGVPSASRNILYASAFDLAAGDDLIDFVDGDGVMFVSSFDMGAGADTIRFSSGQIQSLGAFDLGDGADTIAFGSSTTSSTGLLEAASFDAGDGADTITFYDGGSIDLSSANGDFTLGSGNDSITFNSTSAVLGGGSIDLGTGAFDMGAGDDTVTFNSGGSITAATIAGGTGTDTMNFNSSGSFALNSDVTGVEAINVTDAVLTLGGSVTGGTITLSSASTGLAATSLIIDDGAAGVNNETITATITGSSGDDAVTISNGTVSGAISLGTGDDTLTYSSGSMTGAVAMGTGTDVLNVGAGASVEISNTVSGVETITIQGNTLTVSAAITGVDDANDTGVNVGGNTLNINSGGSIDGAIHGLAGGTVDFGADGNGGTFNLGGIIEDLIFVLTSGTVSTNGFALGGNSALASMTIAAGSTFNAGDNVTIAGALDMSGNMNIDYDAQVSANTIIDNNVGTYDFALFSSGSTLTGGGGINITGGALDFSGGETVTFSIASGSGVIQDGDSVIFASATGGATAPAAWSDSSFLYDFAVANAGANALSVTANQATTLEAASESGNNLVVAQTLLTDPVLVASTDTNIQALQGAAQSAATREEFNNVLEQAQPTIDGSHMAAAMTIVNNTFSLTGDRLSSLRRGDRVTGMNTGNLTRGVKAWSQLFGVTGQQDRRNNIDGYDFDTIGGAFGADTENLVEDTVVGLGFSYAHTNAESDNGSATDTDVDSYQLTVYGEHDLDHRMYVNGMFAYALNNVDTSRTVAGATAKGDFDASQYTTRVEFGRDYGYGNATVTPSIMGHWTHYDADSYTETGAGGAGLNIDGDAVDVVELGVGLDASWLYRNSNGSYFSPEVSIAYRYDLADDNIEMTSQFIGGGQAFKTEGFDPQRHTLDLGAGYTYYSTENWEFITQYDYQWKEDFDSHAGVVRANYRF